MIMMTFAMIMVIIGMIVKINFLSYIIGIKNAKHKKHKLKKSSYPLLGIHQDGGIGVRRRKKRD